jgi:branched-chain amino acid transport system permease protein
MLAVFLIFLLLVFPFIAGDSLLSFSCTAGIAIIATLGLNILTGYCGQVNLGQAAFVAVGGYITAMLMYHWNWSWWAALPISALGTSCIGLLFGLPSLRVKGFYIAMVSLAAYFLLEWVFIHGGNFTGGINGLSVGKAMIFGFSLKSQRDFYFLIIGLVIIMVMISKNLMRGRIGRALIAIRDNDLAGELMGINVYRYKLLAFAICSAFAGIAGSIFALYMGYTHFGQFPFSDNIWYLGYVIVGGIGSTVGSIFGVVFLKSVGFVVLVAGPALGELFPQMSSSIVAALLKICYGATIVIFLILEPRGLFHRWQICRSIFQVWPFKY